MTATIQKTVKMILDRFESGDIPKVIAYSLFPTPDIPSSDWSFLNRLLMNIAGTIDARGIRQWNRAGRKVKKGSRAFYILVPRMVKKETEEGNEKNVLKGFLSRPVFRVEDTEGDPLDYEPPELPENLPLVDKAIEWGLSVEAIPGNYACYGSYTPGNNRISVATSEESVFFHELAHAAHDRVLGGIKLGQDWRQEIVAELSAAVLCLLVGKTTKHLGNNHRYIEGYAKSAGLTAVQACLRVLKDVEEVLNLILEPSENQGEQQEKMAM